MIQMKKKLSKINIKQKKSYAIGLTKKQLITCIILLISGVFIVMGIVIPVAQGNLHFLVVISSSMDPTIRSGDVIVVRSIRPEDVHVNDVITYKHILENRVRYITHRVINITKERVEGKEKSIIFFQTKGDANENPDSYKVSEENLIGKLIFLIPLIGYLINFIHQTIGLLIFIYIPGTIIIFIEIKKIIKIVKKP